MNNIVIVEDDPEISAALEMIFTPPLYHTIVFHNADPVLNDPGIIPDLFMIDRQLPGIDGLQLCATVKKRLLTREVPVIMLSASGDVGRLAKQAGADLFLEKPFHLEDLKKHVATLLKKQH